MLKKSDILNVLSVGLKLFLITSISALILSTINSVTAPVIENNNEIKKNKAMQTVMNDAKSFEKASMDKLATVDLELAVSDIYTAFDADNKKIGYTVMVFANGYGGEISTVIGIDNELKVSGIDIINHSETPSLGAKCTDEAFKLQFVGKSAGVNVVKRDAKDNEIDAISSATITSKAVTKCVNVAITAVSILEGVK